MVHLEAKADCPDGKLLGPVHIDTGTTISSRLQSIIDGP